ncbi:unnamed protein product, partial [Didymodactylos carnosus]
MQHTKTRSPYYGRIPLIYGYLLSFLLYRNSVTEVTSASSKQFHIIRFSRAAANTRPNAIAVCERGELAPLHNSDEQQKCPMPAAFAGKQLSLAPRITALS